MKTKNIFQIVCLAGTIAVLPGCSILQQEDIEQRVNALCADQGLIEAYSQVKITKPITSKIPLGYSYQGAENDVWRGIGTSKITRIESKIIRDSDGAVMGRKVGFLGTTAKPVVGESRQYSCGDATLTNFVFVINK